MKRKFTAVLLCVALLLTLTVNVSAETSITTSLQPTIQENNENSISPMAQTLSIVNNGVYLIKNVASGKYLNLHYGNDADGTNIYQWTKDGSTEQKWRISYNSATQAYQIYSMSSSGGKNRVLDVYDTGGSLVSGSNVKLHTPTEPLSQEIDFILVASGKYKIVMKNNMNMCLSSHGTSNGTSGGTTSTSAGNVFISTYTGSDNQKWMFEYTGTKVTVAPTGWIDSVSDTAINGWAWRSDLKNSPIDVSFDIVNNGTGETYYKSCIANVYRQDLYNAGYGNGYHGFRCEIDWRAFPPGSYTIRAYVAADGATYNLSGSPKTFTVRNPAGSVDGLSSNGISGWVWKPDAPNSAIDVHIYIYKSDNTQVACYPVTANQYRSDLASAGYGNGNHGFSKTIDWSTLPEDNLRVVVYAVDGSGYNPSIYSGYFNNLPIHLIGMIDENGLDRSAWVTQEVISYAENIGAPRVVKHTGATQQNLIDYIHNSRFAVIYTHGTQYTLEWRANANTETETEGSWGWMQVGAIDGNYFSNTDCLLLLACSTASEEDGPNNIAETIESKGIGAVVAFKKKIKGTYANKKAQTTSHAGLWGKVFVRELGDGETVETARLTAFREMLAERCEYYETNTLELEILIENNPQLVQENYYCGLDSSVVLGDPNLVVKQ